MENIKEIKKVLLENENIVDVEINEHNQLVIIPNQSKNFLNTLEPIEKYLTNDQEDIVKILNKRFEVVNVEWFNTTIYQIVLKEYGTCSIDMGKLLKELKEEYLNKEILIQDLARYISDYEDKSERFFFNNIFEYDVREKLDEGFTFLELKDENYDFDSGVNFEFEIIQDAEEDEDNILVKIVSIDLI